VGRETFHSGSQNIFNLHFKFAILIKENKCNHLLFYVLSFIQFCARKLLLPIVFLKMVFIYKVFSTKLYAHEMFGSREFRTVFRVAPKSICGLLQSYKRQFASKAGNACTDPLGNVSLLCTAEHLISQIDSIPLHEHEILALYRHYAIRKYRGN